MTRSTNSGMVSRILLFAMICSILIACNSRKNDILDKVKKMQSTAIKIPYERMNCWTNDSIYKISPWSESKLKLVHYIDSSTCNSCYLKEAAKNGLLHRLESLTNNKLYNVFIANPSNQQKNKLRTEFNKKLTPQTLFVDTAHIFAQMNPNIPPESMYHTFLLDENNKVILVGNPMVNKQIVEMIVSIVKEKLGKSSIPPK